MNKCAVMFVIIAGFCSTASTEPENLSNLGKIKGIWVGMGADDGITDAHVYTDEGGHVFCAEAQYSSVAESKRVPAFLKVAELAFSLGLPIKSRNSEKCNIYVYRP